MTKTDPSWCKSESAMEPVSHSLLGHRVTIQCTITEAFKEAIQQFFLLFYGILPKGRGGLGRSKIFESLFLCPQAIKSKQMSMCQKTKNSEKIIFEFFCFLRYSSKIGGGGLADPKVLRPFLFALKQSKANKCKCAKRLKTAKKLFLIFLLEKVTQKFQKQGGGVRPFWKNTMKKQLISFEGFP